MSVEQDSEAMGCVKLSLASASSQRRKLKAWWLEQILLYHAVAPSPYNVMYTETDRVVAVSPVMPTLMQHKSPLSHDQQ